MPARPARGVLPTRAFSLIELMGVLAVLAIFCALMVPNVTKAIDQAVRVREAADLNTFSNALVLSLLQTKTVPRAEGIPLAIAAYLPLPLSAITNNPRCRSRSFLIDPRLLLRGVFSDVLPYVQANDFGLVTEYGTNPAAGARMMIVSTLDGGNPPVPTGVPSAASFDDLWNTPAHTKPQTWTTWKGDPDDVIIQRINLEPLFVQLILLNRSGVGAATFAIDGYPPMAVPTNGYGWDRWYFADSVVSLCDAQGTVQTRFLLTRNLGLVFENGAWAAQLQAGPRDEAGSAGLAAAWGAASARYYPAHAVPSTVPGENGAERARVLGAMINFMVDYSWWANRAAQTTEPAGAESPLPARRLLAGAAEELINSSRGGSAGTGRREASDN